MKKLVVILFCLTFSLILLTACATSGGEAATEALVVGDASEAAVVEAEDARVGIAIHSFTDPEMTSYREELIRYMVEEQGFLEENITVMDGKNDEEEQINQIQQLLTNEVDVLVLDLVSASIGTQVGDMCEEAGVPVVYIAADPVDTVADVVVKHLNGEAVDEKYSDFLR